MKNVEYERKAKMKKENERLVAQPKGEGKKPLTNPIAPCARVGDASIAL